MSLISSFFSRFRRYGILSVSVLIVVVLIGILAWQQRSRITGDPDITNNGSTSNTNGTTSTRTTFEQFQAQVNRNTSTTTVPTLPTKEQTQQAIQQLQQQ